MLIMGPSSSSSSRRRRRSRWWDNNNSYWRRPYDYYYLNNSSTPVLLLLILIIIVSGFFEEEKVAIIIGGVWGFSWFDDSSVFFRSHRHNHQYHRRLPLSLSPTTTPPSSPVTSTLLAPTTRHNSLRRMRFLLQMSVKTAEAVETNDIKKDRRDDDDDDDISERRKKRMKQVKESFICQIITSIREGTFVSLQLRGPKKKKKKNNKQKKKKDIGNDDFDNEDEMLRGRFKQILFRRILIKEKEYLQVTFKYHLATDIAKNWPLPPPPPLAGVVDDNHHHHHHHLSTSLWSILDPTTTTAADNNGDLSSSSSTDYDVPISEWGSIITMDGRTTSNYEKENIMMMLGIQGGTLITTQQTTELDVGYKTKKPRLVTTKADKETTSRTGGRLSSQQQNQEQQQQQQPENHDRKKQVPVSTKSSFLQALGVTDSRGKPKRAMSSKLRQCQKFVEIVGNLIDRQFVFLLKKTKAKAKTKTKKNNDDESTTPKMGISVLDMGCGRGYLTFSLHSYLQNKYGDGGGSSNSNSNNNNDVVVKSVGIDVRPKLVQEINGIARSLGKDFDGLTFEEGSIEDIVLGNNNNLNNEGGNKVQQEDSSSSSSCSSSSSLDVLIALHACDTATDDAIWCGISRQADIIVVAPCCHKQIRPQLDSHISSRHNDDNDDHHPLADILRHNVYRERQAEMVTDSIRALLLELAGYQVQVFEFIGGEHTAKNVQITAVRTTTTTTTSASESNAAAIRSRLQELAALHGIRKHKLAQWMGEEDLLLGGSSSSGFTAKEQRQLRFDPKTGMPPL